MRIYQLRINPDTGRPETEQFALHSQDAVCVLIPDEQNVSSFWDNPCMRYDCIHDRWNSKDSWNWFWRYTRILYDHSQDRWYLEHFPSLQVSGLFIRC